MRPTSRYSAFARHAGLGIALLFAAFIAACGGGAGTVGLATGTALFTTAASAVNLPVGTSATYTIGGGTPVYQVSSSTPSVATAAITGDTTLTIVGVASGTSQISVHDAAGASVTIAVTVGSGSSSGSGATLYATAASTVTVAIGGISHYTVGGGTGPYIVSSSNTSVANAVISGSNVTVTGITGGTAQVLVFDSTGASVTTTFTVGSGAPTALYTTAPGSITIAVGGQNSYTVGGGTPPYTAAALLSGASASISGTTLTVFGNFAGTGTIAVFDSTDAFVDINVTVGSSSAATPLYVTSASSVTLQVAGTGSYTVGGGTAPYTVSSSNVSVATATIAGGALTIKGVAAGTAQVVIFDSTGASVLIAITVTSGATTTALYTTAPTSIALAVGGVSTYAIGGGTAPYTASSGSTTVAVANVAGSVLSINGVAAGSAQIQVFDSTGASVAITATVTQSSSPVITVVPDGATGNVGDTLQFLFTGGTAPFTATVTDSSIATLSSITTNTNGGSFSATLVNAGSTNVTIVDSTGQTHNFTLIAAQASTTLRLSPSALVIAEDDVNSISYKIYGGTGPYTAFVSDQLLFSVSTSGSTLTAGLGSNANRCVTPIDSTGTYIPYGTFAVTITVVDSLGASATSTVTIQDNGLGSLGTYGPPCD